MSKTIYRVKVPPTWHIGSYSTTAHSNGGETMRQNALWDYNQCRKALNLHPLVRMPKGTRYEKIP